MQCLEEMLTLGNWLLLVLSNIWMCFTLALLGPFIPRPNTLKFQKFQNWKFGFSNYDYLSQGNVNKITWTGNYSLLKNIKKYQ